LSEDEADEEVDAGDDEELSKEALLAFMEFMNSTSHGASTWQLFTS
jgi:hypothetical protein